MNIMVNMSLNTFYKFTNFISRQTHIHTPAIKVTLNGTTHNRTLVNSLTDQ